MANNNDGQIVLGLDIPKTVSQINDDIKKLQGQLDQVKATGALDTSATVKQINAQIATLQAQLNNINIQANVNMNNSTKTSAKQTGQQIGKLISDSAEQAISRVSSPAIGRYFKIDSSTSNQFRTEMEKLVSEWTNAKGKLTDINIQTRTSYDKDADENITRLHQATVTYKNELDEVIKKTIAWRQIGTTMNANGEETVLRGFVEVAGQYSKSLDTVSAKTDTFIDKRKQAVANFEIDLQKIQSRVSDQGASKPIKDQTHIDALETQYNEVNNAIQRLNASTKDTFTDTRIEVEKAIATLENLERQYRNAETTATSLRSKDISTVKSQYSSKLDVLVEKMQSSGVYSSGFQKGADSLRGILDNATDSSGLTQFLNGLDKLEAGYKRAKASADAFNQTQKVGIKVSGLESSISDLQRISPEIDRFEAEINGAKVTIKSLGEDLSKVSTQSDFSVVNEKWKAFTKAAKSAGIAISEVATKSDSLTEKVNKIQHSLEVGDYDAQIETIKKGFVSLSGDANEAETHVKGLRDALQSMHDATDDNGRLTAEKNYRLELEKTDNQLTIAKAKAKEYVDVLKVQKLRNDIQDWLRKNTAATKEAKDAVKAYLATLDDIGHVSQSAFNEAKQGLDNWDTKMRVAGKLGKSFSETFKEGVKSFTSWAISSGAVMECVQAVKTAASNVKELDDQLLELSKVSDLSADGLTKITEEVYKLGDTVGKTGTQVLEAITTFKRAGFELADSTALAETAMKMVNVAEGIDDASESAQYLISIMKGYGDTSTEFATKILDSVNEVSNTQSVDFDNLVDGGQRLSAVANQAGVSFDQMLGVLTGGYEVLGNMEKTASGLITIFTRLQSIQLADEEEVKSVAKLQETFSKATKGKVNIVDQTTGQLRGAYDILNDLNDVWNELDKNTQEGLAFAAGGTRQKSVFLSIMSNWKSVEKSVQSATDSIGSAEEENAKYLESLSGKIIIFESAIEKLCNTVLDSELLKFFVDLGTTGVNAVNGLVTGLEKLNTLGGLLGDKNIGGTLGAISGLVMNLTGIGERAKF